MKYFLALERNEVLTHATLWMNLESIMLNERGPLQKGPCMVPFTGDVQNRNIQRDRRLVLARVEGRLGMGGVTTNGTGIMRFVWG